VILSGTTKNQVVAFETNGHKPAEQQLRVGRMYLYVVQTANFDTLYGQFSYTANMQVNLTL